MPRILILIACAVALAALLAAACGDDDSSPDGSPRPTEIELPRGEFFAAGPAFTGEAEGDRLSAVAAGDFNADGAMDLALGAGQARQTAGAVYVFFGPLPDDAAEISVTEAAITISGDAGSQTGRSLAAADLTGDGLDDLAFSTPADGAGAVYLLVGDRGLASGDRGLGDTLLLARGAADGDFFGHALATGDFNGDGTADLAGGALLAGGANGDREDAGAVYLVFGGPPEDLDGAFDVAIRGAEAGDRLGEAVGAADFDGDGRDDLVAVATFGDGPANDREQAGETYVFTGGIAGDIDLADSPVPVTIYGVDPGDQLGHSVAGLDFNGDGAEDLILGAVSADGAENADDLAGEVALVLGSESPPAVIEARERPIIIGFGKSRLGRSVAGGDIDGDGFADALLAGPERPDRGVVYAVFGGADAAFPETAAAADVAVQGRATKDNLGSQSVAIPALVVADLNGDGLDDVIAGAPGAGATRGGAVVFYSTGSR